MAQSDQGLTPPGLLAQQVKAVIASKKIDASVTVQGTHIYVACSDPKAVAMLKRRFNDTADGADAAQVTIQQSE